MTIEVDFDLPRALVGRDDAKLFTELAIEREIRRSAEMFATAVESLAASDEHGVP